MENRIKNGNYSVAPGHDDRRAYASKTSAVIFSVVLGNGWQIFFKMLSDGEIRYIYDFNSVLPCLLVAFCGYVFYNFLPLKWRKLFYANSYAGEDFVKIRAWQRQNRRKQVGKKIIISFVIEAVILVVSAAVFASVILRGKFHIQEKSEIIIFLAQLVVLLSIIAIPIILVIISYTNLKISNPIMLMAKGVEDFSNRKENNDEVLVDLRELDINTDDEITTLYNSLVRSIDATERYIEKIEREKELEKNLSIATESSKAKSTFLSNMSHEIRTPINAVLGLDKMILRESKEEETLHYARDIQSAGKSLLSLVNDILDFSKIEAGKMEIIPVEYDLSSVVNDLVNMTSKRAEDKGLSLNIVVDKNMPHLLFGDEIRIKQCVLNILTNAIKYTEKGSVELNISSSKIDEEHAALTVHIIDTGIGIKEEDMSSLSQAFTRLDEKRNRTIEGTGLGMSIVKNLLGLMDSKLEVKSKYGEGSDFFFTVSQKVVNWEPIGNYSDLYKKILNSGEKYVESFHAPNARILIVDDTPLNLTVACGLIKQTQMQIDTAESGERTLVLVTKNKYDIIFIDHRMPVMDGMETLEVMKTLESNLNRDTPCIALTANAVSGSRELYLEAGFTDYLSKPIDGKKFEQMIMHYLPKEKVQKVSAAVEEEEEDLPELSMLKGVSVEDGIKNCGGKKLLLQVAKEFYQCEQIEKFYSSGDYKNMTVLVHALKSSARLIGASELSKQAAVLEEAGDRKDEEKINLLMPSLLSSYRSYRELLAPACAVQKAEAKKISNEDFNDALQNIKECLQAFDISTADTIIFMLEQYEIPQEKQDLYKKLKEAVTSVDYDAALKLL